MADEGVTLGARAVEQIKILWAAYLRTVKNTPAPRRGQLVSNGPGTYVAKVGSSGISARSGTTAGTGSITLCKTKDSLEEIDSEDEKEAINLSTTAIMPDSGEDLYVLVCQEQFGKYVVIEPPQSKTSSCLKKIEGKNTTDLPTGTPADVSYFLAVTSDGCIKRIPKSAC